MKLSELIKTERKKQKLTQDKLAERLFCDAPLISMWEKGRRPVPEKRYEELSKALNIPLKEILKAAKEENFMEIEFNKMFFKLETPLDAVNFIEYTLKDFEVDQSQRVSLTAFLRNYLFMLLIITMSKKDFYAEQEGEYFVWDYGWFKDMVSDHAITSLFDDDVREISSAVYEAEANYMQQIAGTTYQTLLDVLDFNPIPEEMLRTLRIHLLEYCHHLDDLATGKEDLVNKYYSERLIQRD